MMREEAIAVAVSIDTIGQQVYLQIPIPSNTHRIIGLEWGAMRQTGDRTGYVGTSTGSNGLFDLSANKVIGRITLWVATQQNIFLQDELVESRNILVGENITGKFMQPLDTTHGTKREAIPCMVEAPPSFVEGFYQDSWGVGEFDAMSYLLHLYLWIEKKCI